MILKKKTIPLLYEIFIKTANFKTRCDIVIGLIRIAKNNSFIVLKSVSVTRTHTFAIISTDFMDGHIYIYILNIAGQSAVV